MAAENRDAGGDDWLAAADERDGGAGGVEGDALDSGADAQYEVYVWWRSFVSRAEYDVNELGSADCAGYADQEYNQRSAGDGCEKSA